MFPRANAAMVERACMCVVQDRTKTWEGNLLVVIVCFGSLSKLKLCSFNIGNTASMLRCGITTLPQPPRVYTD